MYVAPRLILPIAGRLVGTAISRSRGAEAQGGLSWIGSLSVTARRENALAIELARLFPEDVLRYCYDKIPNRQLSVREFCHKAAPGGELTPPDVVTVTGELQLDGAPSGSAFDAGEVDLPRRLMYGFDTFTGTLRDERFHAPVCFVADDAEVVAHANGEPVEVVAVTKWAPPYDVGGHLLNATMLCAALFLER